MSCNRCLLACPVARSCADWWKGNYGWLVLLNGTGRHQQQRCCSVGSTVISPLPCWRWDERTKAIGLNKMYSFVIIISSTNNYRKHKSGTLVWVLPKAIISPFLRLWCGWREERLFNFYIDYDVDDVKKRLFKIILNSKYGLVLLDQIHTGRLGLPRMAISYMMHDFHWLPDGLYQIRIRCKRNKYETYMSHWDARWWRHSLSVPIATLCMCCSHMTVFGSG